VLKFYVRKTIAPIFSLVIASALIMTGSPTSSAAVPAFTDATSSPFGIPCQWLIDATDVPPECAREVAAQRKLVSETKARLVQSGSTEADTRILGTVPGIGEIAAPVERFRDGGHAYYLFGQGLHSCTYTGKCMDLFAPLGQPVYAFAGGQLVRKEYAAGSYGNHLEIRLADKSVTIYAHLQKIVAKNGPIRAGDLIGYVGCSGTSGEFNSCAASEQHLHFEWSALKWESGDYGQLPPFFSQWRGTPKKCYHGC
jgi:hypothetical protein